MTRRPSMPEVLMHTAYAMEGRSSCARNQVGCVVALEGRILSTGYNGAPTGMPHCSHKCDCEAIILPNGVIEHHHECASHACEVAVHAEANAVAFAARHGIALLGSTLYTTLSPCVKCAQLIINAGVSTIVYDRVYRDPGGVDLLVASGTTVMAFPDLLEC